MEPILVAAAILKSTDGRILVCRRADHVPLPKKWEFPGGKVQPDESIFEALHRELREELGLSVILDKELGRVPFTSGMVNYVLVGILGRADNYPDRLSAHSEYGRFTTEEIRKLDLAPADRPLLELLEPA